MMRKLAVLLGPRRAESHVTSIFQFSLIMNTSSSHNLVLCHFGHQFINSALPTTNAPPASLTPAFAIAPLVAQFRLCRASAGSVSRFKSAGTPMSVLTISRSSLHPLNAISIKGVALVNIKRDYKKMLIQCDSQRSLIYLLL